MAISKQTEIDWDRLIKQYLGRTPISRPLKKEGGLILDRISRWRAVIFLLLFAIAAGITVSACFGRPKDMPKMTATVPVNIARLIETKELPALPKLADKTVTMNLFEVLKNQNVQDTLFSCAQSLNSAQTAMAMTNLEGAAKSLDIAIKFWSKLPSSEEKTAMHNEIINARQQIVEYQAKLKIDQAKALLEVKSEIMGEFPEDRPRQMVELLIIKKYLMQLEGATSTKDPALKKEFKDLIVLADALIAKLKATK